MRQQTQHRRLKIPGLRTQPALCRRPTERRTPLGGSSEFLDYDFHGSGLVLPRVERRWPLRFLTNADSARARELQKRDMTLGEMRSLLAENGLRLTRSLGQNFLHDPNQLRRIVALAQLQPGDQVLEIGPGLGPLTEHLLLSGARVLAIEKDARLIPLLRQRLGTHPHLQILHDDALDWIARTEPDASAWVVVANLPYSVGSPILVELTQLPYPPKSITVTLQAEVVDRLRSQPGSSAFGILTLLVARNYLPGQSFRIPAPCFFPAPDVTSACLRLDRRPEPLVPAELAVPYVRLVKRAFSQRRKQLHKILRGEWPEDRLAEAWSRLGLRPDVRPEALSPATFADLTRHLAGIGRTGGSEANRRPT